jgi:stage V sporulation protein G
MRSSPFAAKSKVVASVEITEVRVRKVVGDGKLKAFASITIDGAFVVHDLKVIEGKKGYFVAMPSRKTPNGEFKDTAHPIATEARDAIQKAVLAEYGKVEDSNGPSREPDPASEERRES